MQELLKLAKQSLSIIETSKAKDGEIQMYIDAGINDLTRQGIEVMNKLNNSLVQNAIIMYVKANFGNVDIKEKERSERAYNLLCNNLSLSSDYKVVE